MSVYQKHKISNSHRWSVAANGLALDHTSAPVPGLTSPPSLDGDAQECTQNAEVPETPPPPRNTHVAWGSMRGRAPQSADTPSTPQCPAAQPTAQTGKLQRQSPSHTAAGLSGQKINAHRTNESRTRSYSRSTSSHEL